MRGRGSLRALDPILLLASLALVAVGILFVYSSGVNSAGESVSNEWLKQIVWAGSGCVLLALFAVNNHQKYKPRTPYVFLGALALLVLTLLVGPGGETGRVSWLGIGDLGIQPSEFRQAGDDPVSWRRTCRRSATASRSCRASSWRCW